MAGVVSPITVEEEYKKNNGITPGDINKLRQWMTTQPHLPKDYITDLDLILTYHCCKRSPEVTKQLLDLHYTLKTLFPIFKDRIINEATLKALNVALALPLKVRAHDGSAILYFRLIDYDVKNFTFVECCRALFMVMDLVQYEQGTWPGMILFVDLDRFSLGHVAKLDLPTLQQMFHYVQEAMLLNLKGLHFLSAPSYIDKLMMIIKPFMKKELLNMLVIHQIGSNDLEKIMPLKGAPKCLGGDDLTLDEARDYVKERVKANRDFFATEVKKRVVESQRPGKPKTITDIFGGIEGSFKKLDID